MMINQFFVQLSGIIIITAVFAMVLKKLKQPTLLAYILSGIFLGSSFLNIISFKETIAIFSDLGIAFLLFLTGITLNPKVLKEIGKPSIILGVGQVVFTAVIGALLALALGFSAVEAAYISIALTFSSTIIAVKLLSDKNEINALYAKLAVGALLVQDFIAIIILIFVSSYSITGSLEMQIFRFLQNLIIFSAITYIISKYVVEKIFNSMAKSQELLFLGAISWCLLLASVSLMLGFSKEIGAFLAGVSIAALPYSSDVFAKLRYIRDFFILLFFVALGASLAISTSYELIAPAAIFSIFVLIGNPLIVMAIMLKQGYSARTSFFSGVCLAQISEFSLILAALGLSLGHITDRITSLITIVGVITIALSTYLIVNSKTIYGKIEKYVKPLQKHKFYEDSLASVKEKYYKLLFVGFGKTGKSILRHLSEAKKSDLLIIEFDPKIVKEAIKEGFNCVYGDAADSEMIDFMLKHKPKIVVSTVADYETNRLIAKKLKSSGVDAKTIMLAASRRDAKKLLSEGVDFVLIPSTIAGKTISTIIEDMMQKRSLELDWMKKEVEEDFQEL